MQDIVRQLEQIRGRARRLLLGEAIARWLTLLLLTAGACMLVDYLLRLPNWMRLGVDLVLAFMAVRLLLKYLAEGLQFRPGLGDLALRAENLFPQTRGVLASGVEFETLGSGAGESPALTAAAISEAQEKAGSLPLAGLIDPARALRAAAVLVVVFAACLGVTAAQPQTVALAARRWVAPLGDAQWPKRTGVQSMMTASVWPTDQPLRLMAWVDRGYHAGMRTEARYRIVTERGAPGSGVWEPILMNEQAGAVVSGGGRFEGLIELPQRLAEMSPDSGARWVEFYFQTSDDQTAPQRVELIERPALAGAWLDVQPPRYAEGLISPQTIQLNGQTGQVAAATVRTGSQVAWHLELNKPLPAENLTLQKLMPALNPDAASAVIELTSPTRIVVRMRLMDSVQTPINLVDEHGLVDLSERQYRVQTIADQPPAATVTEPSVDESVLASAVVPVAGVGQDDVAVESVRLEATTPTLGKSESEKTTSQAPLATITGREATLTVNHKLDLSPLQLKPGAEIELAGIAQDVFELDGKRHEPVRSTPRRLHIIDEVQLAGQIRSELAAVRQSAIRLEEQQRELAGQPVEQAADAQQRLSRRLEAQTALLESLQGRIERNRMTDNDLKQLTEQAHGLVKQAVASSQDAQERLDRARHKPDEAGKQIEAAKTAQQGVNEKLVALIDLLDQGQDALTLQLQLQQLAKMQEQLSADTRQTLPQTAGKKMDQLNEAEQRALKDLADRQAALSQRGGALAQQMQTTADALSKSQSNDKDQAAAEALAEAAAIAQKQGLAQEMQQASNSAKQNQLSEASSHQGTAMDTMQQMLEELTKQDRRRREILRRRLLELAQAIEKLIEQQEAQVKRLGQAVALTGLDGPMGVLRRNTVDVAQQAADSRKTQPVAEKLNEAGTQQASAVAALRSETREAAQQAEDGSLALLRDALTLVKQMKAGDEREQRRAQREQLQKQYEQLAKQQDQLREKTEPFAKAERPTRRQKADIVSLGHEEADLRIAASEIGGEGKPLLFKHMHKRIDQSAESAVTTLRAGAAEPAVLNQQSSVATMLRQLAAALQQAQQEEDKFEAGEESGGGGESGGGQTALVPPEAELRLFRGLQESIYNRTRAAGEKPAADDTMRRKTMLELSVEQRELAGLGEALIQRMKQGPKTPDSPQSPKEPDDLKERQQ